MTIIIHKSPVNKQWYFHIKANNGKIIAQSEGYKNKKGCLKSAKSLQKAEYKIEVK